MEVLSIGNNTQADYTTQQPKTHELLIKVKGIKKGA
jgi:hypothetical protein